MRTLLYLHGGSKNHGCEAIVRSIIQILKGEVTLFSNQPIEDVYYNLDQLCKVQNISTPLKIYSFLYLKSFFKYYFKKDKHSYDRAIFNSLYKEAKKSDIILSIGGDNYCYNIPSYIYVLNKQLRKQKACSILLGCSIEEENISGENYVDLKNYSYIIARESITYNSLLKKGFSNISLFPDPAFALNRIDLPLPYNFIDNNTVGINVSPLIMDYENTNGITIQNYIHLIKNIIDITTMQIALIPHVIWNASDDRKTLHILYEQFKSSKRIIMIEDNNAEILKGYIARCRFMVAARTHASIAAYSSQVPTLVVGYSVKARGIARDIFGCEKNYVIPVQDLKKEEDLFIRFKWLLDNETNILKHYKKFMPQYIDKLKSLKNKLEKLSLKQND